MEDKKYKNTTLSDEQAEKKIQEMKHHDLRAIRSVVYFVAGGFGIFASEAHLLSFLPVNGFLENALPFIISGGVVLIFEFFIRRKYPKFDSEKDFKENDERSVLIKGKAARLTLKFSYIILFGVLIYFDFAGKMEILNFILIILMIILVFNIIVEALLRKKY